MSIAVTSAVLPGGHAPGEDRVRTGRNAIVVLDGASGTDAHTSVSDYVDQLSQYLIKHLDDNPLRPLTHTLADAIHSTARTLQLLPGRSPSSTVSIARHAGEHVDLLVLGDSPIYLGPASDRFTDTRLADLDLPSRARLYAHLATGAGYDDIYRQLLRSMPSEKNPHMNTDGGYWIAEAVPQAGLHALTRTLPTTALPWAVMTTDGADDPMTQLDIHPADLIDATTQDLDELLTRLHRWETDVDPHAHALPRYKIHDDKTIAVVTFG